MLPSSSQGLFDHRTQGDNTRSAVAMEVTVKAGRCCAVTCYLSTFFESCQVMVAIINLSRIPE